MRRLLFTGEFSSMWIDETQELKNELYEILLEDFIMSGQLHFKESSVIDEVKMVTYLKEEYNHTGKYTELRDRVKQVIEERKHRYE